jgi:hypothetical protein
LVKDVSKQPEWRKLLHEAFRQMPKGYHDFYKVATEARQEFVQELAAATQERLNPYAQSLPQYSLEDKRKIAYEVNQDLRALNLCLKCPVTGLPAILVGDYGSTPEKDNRFRFEVHQSGRQLRKGAFRQVPDLTVMEAPPRTERWSHRRKSNER